MKRADALAHMTFAGYHADRATFTRLLIENRVSRKVADAVFRRGAAMRTAGMRCTCSSCAVAADTTAVARI